MAAEQAGKALGVAMSKPYFDTVQTSGNGTIGGNLAVTGSISGNSSTGISNTAIHFGTSGTPIAGTASGNFNDFYGTTSASSGDVRMIYARTVWSSTGSGETIRAFSQVTGANGATGGTINGIHASMYVNGSGTISGAGNAIRATLGGTSTAPGGTLSALQLDSDFASGGSWSGATFFRCTNSGTGTIGTLCELPTAMIAAKTSAAVSHIIPIKSAGGTTFYLMVSDQA